MRDTDYVSIFIVFIQRNSFVCYLFLLDIIIATLLDIYAFGIVVFEYVKVGLVPDEDKRNSLISKAAANATKTDYFNSTLFSG